MLSFLKQPKYYYIGLPKTGSTSLSNILSIKGSVHEFMEQETLLKFIEYKKNIITQNMFNDFLRKRTKMMNSQFDITTCNFLYMNLLREEKKSKFITSIRDPKSWINSYLNFKNYYAQNIPIEEADQINKVISYFMGIKIKNSFFSNTQNIQDHFDTIINPLIDYWTLGMESVFQDLPKNSLVLNFYKRDENLTLISEYTKIPLKKIDLNKWNDNVSKVNYDYFLQDPNKYQNIIDIKTKHIIKELEGLGIDDIKTFTPFIYK